MCPPQEQTPRDANVCVLADKNTQQQLGPMFEGLPSTLHSSTWRYTVTSRLVSERRRLRVGLNLCMQVFVTNEMLITTFSTDFHPKVYPFDQGRIALYYKYYLISK